MWSEHVLRHESLLHDIIEGRMKGKATRGWKRINLLSDLMKNRSYMEIKKTDEKLKTELARESKCRKPAVTSRRRQSSGSGNSFHWLVIVT